MDLCTGRIGCWMITHPDKGSDVTMVDVRRELPAGQQGNKGNMWGRLQGDEIVINGQCSAWVSNGAVAQVALGYLSAEYGDGFFGRDGHPHGMAVIIPLDLPGVSKGKPLDKIGQRSLPQGEIYFDNVQRAEALRRRAEGRLLRQHDLGLVVCRHPHGRRRSPASRAPPSNWRCSTVTNASRAAGLLIDHQLTRYRLGDMLRRVELCRSVARRSLAYARLSPLTHPYVTAAGKVTVTQEAMKVVDEAFQLFGGAGTSREYPIEKLFRDARVALIEDGENTS